MRRVGPRLLLAVTLAVLAGCPGLASPGPSPPPATPAPVPDQPAPLAPGVPASAATGPAPQTIDRAAVRRADARRLDDRSYTVTQTAILAGPNRSLHIRWQRHVTPEGRVKQSFRADGAGPLTPTVTRSDLWGKESRYWVRSTLANGHVSTVPQPERPAIHTLAAARPSGYLAAATYDINRRSGGGAVLVSTGRVRFPRRPLPVATATPRNASVRLLVTADGVVESLLVRYDTSVGDRQVQVSISQQVTAIGNTTVSRPAWAGDGSPQEP
ncbi:hypothetical protein [Haloarcula pelagica]|uniref:hypothetical protein n=1 Tax=Halomicroarcula sp. GCM10025709 TaxID=3252669 RepID=UPI0036D2C8E1